MDRDQYRTFKDENPEFVTTCRGLLGELEARGVQSYSATKLIAVAEFLLLKSGIRRGGRPANSIPHEFAPLLVADLVQVEPKLAAILRTKSNAGYRGREADRGKRGAA